MFRRLLLFAAIALVLPAQAQPIPEQPKVSIVAALGSFHLDQTDWASLSYRHELVSLDTSQFNSYAQQKVAQLLPPTFKLVEPLSAPIPPLNCEGVSTCAASLPKTDQIDLYLLIFASETAGISPRYPLAGLGMFRIAGYFNPARAVVHAIYQMAFIDAHTGRVIKVEEARSSETVFGGEHAKPLKELDGATWPGNASNLNNAQRETIQAAFRDVFDKSLPYTLNKLLNSNGRR